MIIGSRPAAAKVVVMLNTSARAGAAIAAGVVSDIMVGTEVVLNVVDIVCFKAVGVNVAVTAMIAIAVRTDVGFDAAFDFELVLGLRF